MNWYIKLTDNIITHRSTQQLTGFFLFPSEYGEPMYGDAFVSGVLYPHPHQDPYNQDGHIREAYTFNPVSLEWEVDHEQFAPLLSEAIANYRWNLVDNLTATVVANTYVEDGEDFVVDEEDAELQLKVNAGTEASLFTKVHVTPNAPAPKSHEGYKFVNKNVIVTRDTFAAGLVAIDTVRQPYFDAERKTMGAHKGTPFFTVQEAIDFFNNKLGL